MEIFTLELDKWGIIQIAWEIYCYCNLLIYIKCIKQTFIYSPIAQSKYIHKQREGVFFIN